MMDLIYAVPVWLLAACVVGGSVSLALLGMGLVRRFVPPHTLAESQDSAGVTFAVIAGFYGVLAAFVVVAVWEQFDLARHVAEQEASVVADVHRMARAFPDDSRDRLQREVVQYASAVVDLEWPALAQGGGSPEAQRHFSHLWSTALALPVQGDSQAAAYGVLLDRMNDLSDLRRQRLVAAAQGIPGLLWALLVVGAVVTLGSSFFMVTRHSGLHVMLTLALSTSISFVLFLILALDYPFSGSVAVTPEAFKATLESWR